MKTAFAVQAGLAPAIPVALRESAELPPPPKNPDQYNLISSTRYGNLWIPKPRPELSPHVRVAEITPESEVCFEKENLGELHQSLIDFLNLDHPSDEQPIVQHIRNSFRHTPYQSTAFDRMIQQRFWRGLAEYFSQDFEMALDQRLGLGVFQMILESMSKKPNRFAKDVQIPKHTVPCFLEKTVALDKRISMFLEDLK